MMQAEAVGVQMHTLDDILVEIEKPLLYEQVGRRPVIDALGPGGDRLIGYPNDPGWTPEIKLGQSDRISGLTRAQAEDYIERFLAKQEDGSVGSVDVDAYARALQDLGYYPSPGMSGLPLWLPRRPR